MFTAQSIEEARRYAEMAESLAGVGYWRLCAQTQAITWSPNMYRIFGFDPARPPSLSEALERLHPDDRANSRENLESRGQGASGPERVRIVLPTGDLRFIESKSGVECDDDGVVLNHYGTVADITEHLLAQNRLAASEARWRLLTQNASDIIACYGLDGLLTYVSPAVEGTLGLAPVDLVGRPGLDMVAPEDQAGVREAFQRIFDQDAAETARIEFRARHADGREVWLEASPHAVRDDTGRIVEIQDVIRDISARKQIETDLMVAKAEAETATRLKGEFVANITHELRTPLTSVIGYARLVQEPGIDPERRLDYVRRIASAGEALLSTINAVLDFSSLESGQAAPRPTVQSIGLLARDVAALFEAQAAPGVAIECQIAADVPDRLLMDGMRVRQVMQNLIGNAVKFTERGQIVVGVTVEPGAKSFRVAVRDSGRGIAPAAITRLFQRFSQVDGSSTRTGAGTGLGLAIAKGLVASMAGEIGVDSIEGVGSTFWFTLPLLAADTPTAGSYGLSGLRTLVIDDQPVIGQLVAAMLMREGVDVQVADSGATGLAVAQSSPFDAIFVDLNMPGLGGFELAERIRFERGVNQFTPLAALTAAGGAQLEKARSLFDAVVQKPVADNALYSTLQTLTTEDLGVRH